MIHVYASSQLTASAGAGRSSHPLVSMMRAAFAMVVLAVCLGCVHTNAPFIQYGIRIVPPVIVDQKDTLNLFNDGGTRWFKITDAEGKKFDVYVDHRLVSDGANKVSESKTSGDIYLMAYPGHSNSVRVLNQQEFKKKIGDFK
jgi:hypothetical protein